MADISDNIPSVEQQELKVMEIEYRLNDQKSVLMKMEIEEKRMAIRIKELQNNKNDVKKAIQDVEAQLRDAKKTITEK